MPVDTLPTEIHLEIVTPERQVVRDSVTEVSVPGKEGEMGILPGHAPLLSLLKVGELSYVRGKLTHYLCINWGFVEVLPDRVIVLAQTAERAEDIDLERARKARERAEERLKKVSDLEVDLERARIALERSLVRIQVAGKARN
ncbi:MAG TPA: F0F1 ATP synthase subunit epsilon [Terriglobia bacterium]|nr:F0F1 ATP synthase subunit epsilon [Terriglobia bacterium]